MSGSDIGPLTKEQQDIATSLHGVMQQTTIADALGPMLAQSGRAYSEEAKGFFENARYQADAAGKAFADGIAHIGTTAFRLGANFGTMAKGAYDAAVTMDSSRLVSWGEADQATSAGLERITGSPDPGALDLLMGPFSDTSKMSVGERASREINNRLGSMAVFGESVGAIASFAVGPGGALGKEVAGLVRPMGLTVERAVARKLASKALSSADQEVVGAMMRSGQPLRALAQLPEWKQQASQMTKLLGWGGRNIEDLLSTTAALTAQSYAMTDHEHQNSAAMSALLTGPLITPIARAGQFLSSRIATAGLSQAERAEAGRIYEQVARGRLSVTEADDMIRKSVSSFGRRALANVISSAFEGSAFTWMHGQSWDDLKAWYGGDSDAGVRLVASWLGSTAGIAVTKYAVPHELAPLFAHVRPDLNSLRIYAEAEAIRRRPTGWTEDAMAARTRRMPDSQGPWQGPVDPNAPPPPRNPTDPWLIPIEREVAMYDWAETPTRGLLGGGFRPVWPDGPMTGESVNLQFGERGSVTLHQDGAVEIPAETRKQLETFRPGVTGEQAATKTQRVTDPATGVVTEVQVPIGPDRATGTTLTTDATLNGEAATKALDALSLLGTLRSMEGALQFGRMGLREVQPGVWANDQTGEYWSMNLDGSSTRRSIDGKNKAREMLATVGGYGDSVFASDSLEVLQHLALNHSVMAPDAIVDGILTQSVLMAKFSQSVGGDNLRAFLSEAKPEDLAAHLTRDGQDFLAMQLGMLGAGLTNAPEAIKALRAAAPKPVASQGPAPEMRPVTDRQRVTDKATGTESVIERQAQPDKATGTGLNEVAPPPETAPPAPISQPGYQEPQGPVKPATGSQSVVDKATGVTVTVETAPQRDPATGTILNVPASLGEKIAETTPTPAARGGAWKERGRLEQLATAAEGRGDQALADAMRNMLETGSPEQIRRMVEEHGTGYAGSLAPITSKDVAGVVGKAVQAGKKVWDYFVTDRVERIRNNSQSAVVREWADNMDKARADKAQTYGQAQTKFRAAEKALRKMGGDAKRILDINGTPTDRWVALMEGKVEPANANEKLVADGLRDTALYLWNEAVRVGTHRYEMGPSGDVEWRPLTERDKAVMPRQRGADWDAIYDNVASREALFEWLIEKNGLKIRDPETRQVRPMTVKDMTEQWLDTQVGTKVQRAERNTAFEFVRQLREVPSMFQGKRLLEANPFEAMRRMMHEQSGRIATIKTWGQDVPESVRTAFRQKGVEFPAGAENSLRAMQRDLAHEQGSAGVDLGKLGEDVLVTLQGGAPKKLHPWLKALAPFEGVARSAQTMLSFIHDIPAPFIQGPAYAGIRRTMRALAAFSRSPREIIINAERAGSLLREIGSHNIREADGKLQSIADTLAWFSTKSERGKTALFDRMAVEMLADWGRGRVTNNDRDVMRDMLRIQDDVAERLLSGKASEAEQARFRREFVKMTTGRRTQVEGSEFAANPNLQKLIRYGNWITGRAAEIGRATTAIARKDATPGQRARAFLRAAGLTAGWTVSGMVTPLVAYLIQDLFRGENGWKRWLREVGIAPGQMALRGLSGQVASGPVGGVIRAMQSEDAKDWANLTSVTSLAYAVHEALNMNSISSPIAMAKAAGQIAADYGVVPRIARDLGATVSAAMAGEDTSSRSDARAISTWERLEGIPRDHFARTKAPEFYDALASIRDKLNSARGEPADRVESVLREAEADIRKALSLAPEESVAAAVRSFQHLGGKSPEQRAKLQEYLDDDAQMQRIYAHDMAMRELASAIGRMHGEGGAPIEQEIQLVEGQARLGDASQWRKLVDRALEDATIKLSGNEPIGSELRDLAESYAAFPDHLEQVLSPRQARALTRPGVTYAYRARMLQTILERRARERVIDLRREEIRKRNGQ